MEIIRGRRSVRSYRGEKLSDEIVQRLCEAVRWAPSWANTQCWEIVVIDHDTIKALIADTLSKGNPARQSVADAPMTFVFVAIKGASGFKKSEACTQKGDWYMFDIGLAVENFCLAAHSMGLGTVVVGYFDATRVGEILGVPGDREVVALAPVGMPSNIPGPPKRKEVREFVFYNGYGER